MSKIVQSIKLDLTLTKAIVKGYNGRPVSVIEMSDTILNSENKTVRANLNPALASGHYTVTLVTTKGNSFVSPTFTIPDG